MVYNHVDPLRKKGDKPIREYVVYCDKECHKEWWDFIQKATKAQREETLKEIREVVIKQKGIGQLIGEKVNDYISRPKLLDKLNKKE